MGYGAIITIIVIVAFIGLFIWAYSSMWANADKQGNVAWNKEITFTVTKMWIDAEKSKTYYLVSGTDQTGTHRVIELSNNWNDWFHNVDNDYGFMEVGGTYTLKCTGIQNGPTYDNWQCTLVR